MQTYRTLWLLPWLMTAVTCAQPAEEDGQIKIQNWDTDKVLKKQTVAWSEDNLVIETVKEGEKEKKNSLPLGKYFTPKPTPATSLAARIEQSGQYFAWRPKWYFSGGGGTELPALALSPDGSILAIVELVGDNDGPFGSRILFLNTYTWKFAGIINQKKRKITKIAFVPESDRLVAWAEKQTALKMPFELLELNCKNGHVASSTTTLSTPVKDLVCAPSGSKLYVTNQDWKGYYVFAPGRLDQDPVKVKSREADGKIALSQDNSRLVLAGKNTIEFFQTENNQTFNSLKLPENGGCSAITFAGRNSDLAWLSTGDQALFFKSNLKLEICDKAGPLLLYNPDECLLAVSKVVQTEILLIAVPGLETKDRFFPVKTAPKTKDVPEFCAYLPHLKAYLFADQKGNFYLMTKSKKKWVKQVIIAAAS